MARGFLCDQGPLRRLARIADLGAYFAAYPEQVQACFAGIRVLDVNQRTLEMFGAADLEQLKANLGVVFRVDMHDQHARDMEARWKGEPGFSSQSVNYALYGRRIDVLVNARILPGYEKDWSRVMVSLEDVTERVAPRRAELSLQ